MKDLSQAAKRLPQIRYSLRLHHEQLDHLKNNSQGLPPSVYLRSLVEADVKRGGGYHAETI